LQLKGGKCFSFHIPYDAWERPNRDWRQRSAGDFTLREGKRRKKNFPTTSSDASSRVLFERGRRHFKRTLNSVQTSVTAKTFTLDLYQLDVQLILGIELRALCAELVRERELFEDRRHKQQRENFNFR
jgi:hypothetical protein